MEEWHSRPLTEEYPYVYADGVCLKRSWGGEIQNVAVFLAIGVNKKGYHEILGAAESMKEDHESWKSFFIWLIWLKERGLKGVRLISTLECSRAFPKFSRKPAISAAQYISTEMYSPSHQEQRCEPS